jgi:hypothetical protein
MGRLLNMTRTDVTPAQSVASAAAYNEANQLVSYTANNILNREQRQYDTMRRLTSLRIGGGVPMLQSGEDHFDNGFGGEPDGELLVRQPKSVTVGRGYARLGVEPDLFVRRLRESDGERELDAERECGEQPDLDVEL